VPRVGAVPHRVVRRRRGRRQRRRGRVVVEAAERMVVVVEEAVHVAGDVAVHGEGGVEVGPLGVLALALVRVLVPAQRLRCREVAAAVVALEHALGRRRLAAVALRRDRAVVVGRVRGVLGRLRHHLVAGELAAEQPDGVRPRLLLRRRRRGRRTDEGQLRERVDAAHVLRLRHGPAVCLRFEEQLKPSSSIETTP
jgi:hypothetical protein